MQFFWTQQKLLLNSWSDINNYRNNKKKKYKEMWKSSSNLTEIRSSLYFNKEKPTFLTEKELDEIHKKKKKGSQNLILHEDLIFSFIQNDAKIFVAQ